MPDRASARGLAVGLRHVLALTLSFLWLLWHAFSMVPLFDGVWRGKQRSTLDGRAYESGQDQSAGGPGRTPHPPAGSPRLSIDASLALMHEATYI